MNTVYLIPAILSFSLMVFAAGSIVITTSKKGGESFFLPNGSIVASIAIFCSVCFLLLETFILYSAVGKAQDATYVYYPFNNGTIYEKTWESKRNGEFLFSVARESSYENGKIWNIEKDSLPEVFSSPVSIPELFIVLDGKFLPISERERDEIFYMGYDETRVKKFLNKY